jgi:uncharacterized cupredoxin-like copper-binding protein
MIQPALHRPLRRSMLTASLSLLLVGVAACGSDSKSEATTAPAATTAAAPAATTAAAPAATTAPTTAAPTTAAPAATTAATTAAAATGTPVDVAESEFKIDIPASLTAGTYTFNISNTGQFKHNLIIEGNGTKVQSDTLDGGATGTLSAPLTAGSYEVYCGVPTHKGKGMDLTITVA